MNCFKVLNKYLLSYTTVTQLQFCTNKHKQHENLSCL